MKVVFFLFFWLVFPTELLVGLETITPETALSIGKAAYIYGYPLVLMEKTRELMTNVTKPDGARAPMAEFAHARMYPKASFTHLKAPDTDTLFSVAWVDLSQEPYIFHLPEIKGRYYLFTLISGWRTIVSSIGTRTTGSKEGSFALTGPNWKGDLPKGFTEIKSPTNMLWIFGKTFCTGAYQDYKAVHQIQDLYLLRPLSSYKDYYKPVREPINPKLNMKIPIANQVDDLDIETYFNLLTSLMKGNPPSSDDQEILNQIATIGIKPGESFSLSTFSSEVQEAFKKVPQAAQDKIETHSYILGTPVCQWIYLNHTQNQEKDYLRRAVLAMYGLGTALPEDQIYAYVNVDEKGGLLHGKNHYILHFPKDQTPPVKGFWSLAAYNSQFELVPNALNRFDVNPLDIFLKKNHDGSLDIYIQNESPGHHWESNWLPVPNDTFVLMLRFNWPEEAILKETWKPPAVTIDPFD